MCAECDVEVFMVLPRLIWLCFLADPSAKRAELVRNLLPHRFEEGTGSASEIQTLRPRVELEALLTNFAWVKQVLSAWSRHNTFAWEVLVKRAVQGSTSTSSADGVLRPTQEEAAETAVESLMRDLEPWSLELQRHC